MARSKSKAKGGAAAKARRMHKKVDGRYKGGVRKSGLKVKSGPAKGRPRPKGKK
jgi:hypothetical protein